MSDDSVRPLNVGDFVRLRESSSPKAAGALYLSSVGMVGTVTRINRAKDGKVRDVAVLLPNNLGATAVTMAPPEDLVRVTAIAWSDE